MIPNILFLILWFFLLFYYVYRYSNSKNKDYLFWIVMSVFWIIFEVTQILNNLIYPI